MMRAVLCSISSVGPDCPLLGSMGRVHICVAGIGRLWYSLQGKILYDLGCLRV